MWQAKLANSTCLASLDYAWKPSWISAELSPFLFKMVFWYLSKWRHGIIILAVKKLGLKIHFYEKWGYLFLPTNMTISWGHGLWTLNDSFFQISQIFWPTGQIGRIICEVFKDIFGSIICANFVPSQWFCITKPFFLQKAKIFIHFTEFSRIGIWFWAVENLRSNHHVSVVRAPTAVARTRVKKLAICTMFVTQPALKST